MQPCCSMYVPCSASVPACTGKYELLHCTLCCTCVHCWISGAYYMEKYHIKYHPPCFLHICVRAQRLDPTTRKPLLHSMLHTCCQCSMSGSSYMKKYKLTHNTLRMCVLYWFIHTFALNNNTQKPYQDNKLTASYFRTHVRVVINPII